MIFKSCAVLEGRGERCDFAACQFPKRCDTASLQLPAPIKCIDSLTSSYINKDINRTSLRFRGPSCYVSISIACYKCRRSQAFDFRSCSLLFHFILATKDLLIILEGLVITRSCDWKHVYIEARLT